MIETQIEDDFKTQGYVATGLIGFIRFLRTIEIKTIVYNIEPVTCEMLGIGAVGSPSQSIAPTYPNILIGNIG